jgi:3-oxoacyl-[acyl-carrier-protein] synthase-3
VVIDPSEPVIITTSINSSVTTFYSGASLFQKERISIVITSKGSRSDISTMKISGSCVSILSILLGLTNAAFIPNSLGSTTFVDRRSSTSTSTSSSKLDMASSGAMGCRPIGVGHAAPKRIVTNVDLESVVETNDEWIQTRTGIAQRRLLTGDETLRSLGVVAANEALKNAGVKAEDIDLVICATSSPDDMFGDATAIAAEIGCSTDTMAFDLTAACSGFLFATATAGQFLSSPSSKMKNVLVIGADALSRWVDWDDRNVCILFGDGAGAMVMTNEGDEGDAPGILGFAAHSNGKGYPDLNCL